jgi:N6-adenosine-specific RNA methylase IME4
MIDFNIQNLPLSQIIIGEKRRPLGDISQLASSIKEVGLINPITVNKDLSLIAGHHRLKAFELLGFDTIPAKVIDVDSLHARLTEIDENLIQHRLSEAQECLEIDERKKIYLQLYPDTKHGGDRKSATFENQNEKISFCSDTAQQTGLTKRSIEMKASIGEKLNKHEDIKQKVVDALVPLTQTDLKVIVDLAEKDKHSVIDDAMELVENGKAKNIKSAVMAINIQKQKEDIEQDNIVSFSGLYDVISIDPPWQYESGSNTSYDADNRRVANPYPEMSLEQIKAIEIPAKDDAVLWLWTTHKYLPESFELLKHWGFEYKAVLVWNKQKMGMGSWLRMQCEFCLLAIKGRPVWDNTTMRDIIDESRREHSRKPDAFYETVSKICTGRKLEFFARETREGWEKFGNDVSKFDHE